MPDTKSKPASRADIVATTRALLAQRAPGKTICPSEVARALADDWRPLMPQIRAVAAELVAAGEIEMTQKGTPIDPHGARGPVRLRARAGLPT
jgi:hypothetical protein